LVSTLYGPRMDDTTATPNDTNATAALIALLDVEQHGPDLFRGPRKQGGVGRVFGGQVLAQALASAQRTVEGSRAPHSLHAYFLRGASEDHEIAFQVERDFDGRSLSNRRVIASQLGKPIFNLTASFHIPESGAHHQDAMPEVPPPEALESEAMLSLRPEYAGSPGVQTRQHVAPAVEIRPTEPRIWIGAHAHAADSSNWIRVSAKLGDDPALHRAVLTYISDLVLLGTALLPHMAELAKSRLSPASLDHAIWFHDDFRADEWMLFVAHSPWAGRARGFTRGEVYRRDGRMVATIAQEGLMRMVPK
jgi:acyl-CoA thioesterase-2